MTIQGNLKNEVKKIFHQFIIKVMPESPFEIIFSLAASTPKGICYGLVSLQTAAGKHG